MHKRFLIIALVVILAAAGLWHLATINSPKQDAVAETGVTVGKKLTPFTLPDLEGKSIALGKPGKVTVINFWATWCPPCRAEMPELDRFYQKYRQTVDFYAVNVQEPPGQVAEFLAKNQYSLPVITDKEGAVARMYRINAIPTTIVVDAHGVIRYRKAGGVTMAELEGVIKELL